MSFNINTLILSIGELEWKYISSYEKFIKLTDYETIQLYSTNDFNLYKHYIKQACLKKEIRDVHLMTKKHRHEIAEMLIELIHNGQTINSSKICYTLITKFYPTYLNLDQILRVSNVRSIDEFYDKVNNGNFCAVAEIFLNANIMVNYLKNTQVDIHYINKLLNNGLEFRLETINNFSNVYDRFFYPKIPICEVLELFHLSGSHTVIFKKKTFNNFGTYDISISHTKELRQTIKKLFEKVCTNPNLLSDLDPYYIKYNKIMNLLNTKWYNLFRI